jgi:hypothetical protein
MFIHARENNPLPSLVDLDDSTQQDVLESADFLRTTVVRNPYTRFISAWRNKVMLCEPGFEWIYSDIKGNSPKFRAKSMISLEEFIAHVKRSDADKYDPHWRIQTDHIFFPVMNFTLIGKVENLSAFFKAVCDRLSLTAPGGAAAENTSKTSLGVGLTEPQADEVFALYAADFQAFGYARQDWPATVLTDNSTVSEEKFNDEIIERNMIIAHLYSELNWTKSELEKMNKFHLSTMANLLLTIDQSVRGFGSYILKMAGLGGSG